MICQCFSNNWRRASSFFSVLCICTIGACSGGLVGTGTGPASNEDAVYLPRKIGPRMPVVLLQNGNGTRSASAMVPQTQEAKSQQPLQRDSIVSEPSSSAPRSTEPEQIAQNWQRLSPHFTRVETTRVALELELFLLEHIYDQVLAYCEGQDANDCLIPANEIEVEIVPALTQLLNNQNGRTAPPDSVRSAATSLLANPGNGRIALGELRIQRLQDEPFSNRLLIRPLTLVPDHHLSLQWSSDFSQIQYQLGVEEQQITQEYYYQSSLVSQRLAYQDFAEPENNNVQLEISAQAQDTGDVAFRGRLGDDTILGRSSGAVAYAASTDISSQMITEEVFQPTGLILDMQTCGLVAGSSTQDCDQILLAEAGPLGLSDAAILTTEDSGFSQIEVLNLPDSVQTFEIREEIEGLPVTQWPALCHGWRSPLTQLIEVICYTSPTLAVGGVVVAYDQMGSIFRIAGVELAIQD